MQAVILAAGKGERLLPLTQDIPKPMVFVGQQTIFEWCLQPLRESGLFDNYVVCTGYKENMLIDFIKEGVHYAEFPADIKFSTGGPRGVNGDLLAAKDFLEDRFVLVNGDTYVEIDYEKFKDFHSSHSGLATMAVSKYGDHNYRIYRENGNVLEHSTIPNCTDAGVCVCEKKALDLIDAAHQNLHFGAVETGGFLMGFDVGKFYDLGTHEGIETFKRERGI